MDEGLKGVVVVVAGVPDPFIVAESWTEVSEPPVVGLAVKPEEISAWMETKR